MIFSISQAASGYLQLLEIRIECEFGVDHPPGRWVAPTVSSFTQGALLLNQRKAGAWAWNIPTVPAANASLGSTHRPVQLILLITPSCVALARVSTVLTPWGLLK